jgi:hypothetical protein
MLARAWLALCVGVVVLAVAAGSAGATVERLMFMQASRPTMRSVRAVTFTVGEVTVRCELTLEAELLREIPFRAGERVGSISRVTSSRCEEGTTATFLSFPWSLTYSSFSGTQPEGMTGMLTTMRGLSVSLRLLGGLLTCLFRGDVGLNFELTGESPYEVRALTTLSNTLSLVSGGGCPATASMSGTFELSPAELLVEVQVLSLIASPPVVRRAEATGLEGKTVTFFPSIQTVIVNGGGWRDGSNGWRTEITPCIGEIRYPAGSCSIVIRAEAAARTNQLRLNREGGGIAGIVNVGP